MFEAPQKYALKKTGAEKDFLKSISALERSFLEEKDPALRDAYSQQLRELKARLSGLSSRNPANVSGGKARARNQTVLRILTSLSENGSQGKAPKPAGEENLLRYYGLILRRHSSLISEKERKTVGEIKSMVTKTDLTVQSLAQGFAGENYSPQKDYRAACQKAYEYVQGQILNLEAADLGFSFWLTPKEIVSERLADDEDKALLLCSLLFALGDEKAECVISELEGNAAHAFVVTELEGNFLLLDPSQQAPFGEYMGQKAEVIEKYSFRGSPIKKFLYRFNSSNYEMF